MPSRAPSTAHRRRTRLFALLCAIACCAAFAPAAALAHDGHVHLIKAGAAFDGRAQVATRCIGRWVNVPGQGRSCRTVGGLWRVDTKVGADLFTHGADVKSSKAEGALSGLPAPASTSSSSVRCADAGAARYRVIYALPLGEIDKYSTREASVRQMVLGAGEALRLRADELSPGLDMKLNVVCDGGGQVLVQKVVLYTGTNTDTYSTIVSDIRKRGVVQPGENVVAFVEGQTGAATLGEGARPADSVPGYGNAVNRGGNVALVYRNGGASWAVALHEMGHTMGAVSNGSPNSSLGGHCIDGLDVMCYRDTGSRGPLYTSTTCPASVFDCGANDYFNPAPAGGSWLATHFNLASPQNQFLRGSRASDTTAPTAAITSPASDGIRASEVVVDGGDDVGVDRVELVVNGTVAATTRVLPARFPLAAIAPGATSVVARIHDTNGNTTDSATRNFVVDASGPTLSPGPVPVSIGDLLELHPTVSDPAGIAQVRVWTSATSYVADVTGPDYTLVANTASWPLGTRTFDIEAIDTIGNSTRVPVTVSVERGTGLVGAWYADDSFSSVKGLVAGVGPLKSAWTLGPAGTAADGWAMVWGGRVRLLSADGMRLAFVADDKIRVTVDGSVVLDEWNPAAARLVTTSLITGAVGSWHDVRIEYSDVSGPSNVQMYWQDIGGGNHDLGRSNLKPDLNVPTAMILAPGDGADVTDTTLVRANVSDDVAVKQVEFRLDGKVMNTDGAAPFEWAWNTLNTVRGPHVLSIVPIDGAGNRGVAATSTVNVHNGRGLLGTYYSDTTLATVKTRRLDSTVNFTWGVGSPAPGVAADNFSVRWEGRLRQPDGDRTMTFVYDDGMRVSIDGVQVLDRWSGGAGTATYTLTGSPGDLHDIVVEQLETTGTASMRMLWATAGSAAVAVPAQYLYAEEGMPTADVESHSDGDVVYGASTITVGADDPSGIAKVEVLVDGKVFATDPTYPYSTVWTPVAKSNGPHVISARATDFAGNVTTAAPANVVVDIGTGLRGRYWSEPDFATGTTLTRIDALVNFVWGTAGPTSAIGIDTFSARWTGRVRVPDASARTLMVQADDGVRVTLDGVVVADELATSGGTRTVSVPLPAGAANRTHDLQVDYVEQSGMSNVKLLWQLDAMPVAAVPTTMLYPGPA